MDINEVYELSYPQFNWGFKKEIASADNKHVLWNYNKPYFYDDERHKLPHIHAKYQGQDASFSIIDGSVLAGEIPLTKVRLV